MSDTATCTAPSPEDVGIDFSKHPCFSREAHHKFGRIHLPVAPRCNIQCNFCNRQYDCMNESRPGVTSAVLKPWQAIDYLTEMLEKRPEITVLGIAGPGDPFANCEETMETLRLARAKFPKLILCLASNGLGIAPYIDEIAKLKTSHVTITINAIDPAITAKVYAWVRENKTPLRGLAGAALLLERQLEAIRKLKEKNIVVKTNTIIMPGINDEHIPVLAKKMGEMGVDIMNCMPLIPVKGAAFEEMPAPDQTMIARVRLQSGLSLPQMVHCARCRADAIGLINEKQTEEQLNVIHAFSQKAPSGATRPCIAVASLEGMLVNQHLGEANRFLIYEPDAASSTGYRFKEVRIAPEAGRGVERWKELAEVLKDCRIALVSAAGTGPRAVLDELGIQVMEMEGLIDEGLRPLFENQPLPAVLKRRLTGCSGPSCRGTGTGCG
jgi:nitrogen fixation protein NifB